jgi:hypothetical protein
MPEPEEVETASAPKRSEVSEQFYFIVAYNAVRTLGKPELLTEVYNLLRGLDVNKEGALNLQRGKLVKLDAAVFSFSMVTAGMPRSQASAEFHAGFNQELQAADSDASLDKMGAQGDEDYQELFQRLQGKSQTSYFFRSDPLDSVP